MRPKDGIWLGVKPCGCIVAACREDGSHIDENNAQKLAWLDDGLTVFFATRAEWEATYLPRFLADCPHEGQGYENESEAIR